MYKASELLNGEKEDYTKIFIFIELNKKIQTERIFIRSLLHSTSIDFVSHTAIKTNRTEPEFLSLQPLKYILLHFIMYGNINLEVCLSSVHV